MFQPNLPKMWIKKVVIIDFTPDMLHCVWEETEYQWGGCPVTAGSCTKMLWQHIKRIHSGGVCVCALFTFNLFQLSSYTYFEQAYCSSSGGTTLYIQQLVYVMCLC